MSRHPIHLSVSLTISLTLIGTCAFGQTKAQPCFFGTDFEGGDIPADWDLGPMVERQSADGTGLGEFVSAWVVGDADQANTGGFFPVTDIPTNNLFAMANDDASPCNCDMSEVALTTPSIDLSGRVGAAMECRAFNDQTLGGGPATIQASLNSGAWITLLSIPVVTSDWQDLFVDLSLFDDQPDLRLRFVWSDNGSWASGFAVDDICVRERFENDFTVLQVHANDPSISPFQTGDQSLRYSMLPLEQAAPMTVAVNVLNSGTNTLENAIVSAILHQNGIDHGPFSGTTLPSLVPGERATMLIETGWTPEGSGEVDVLVSGEADGSDEDVNDNNGMYVLHITGPGWEYGYGAMARDDGIVQGSVGGQQNFIAAVRMELINSGSVPKGISSVLGANSVEGEQIRGIIMDENLAFVDTTTRRTLSAEDVELVAQGAALYLPFDAPTELEPGDHYIGMQHLDGSGEVYIATSGNGPVGASVVMEGVNFEVSYLRATPMVRLHLDDLGVGIQIGTVIKTPELSIYPVPMADLGQLRFTLDEPTRMHLSILDLSGRVVEERDLGRLSTGVQRVPMNMTGLRQGIYLARVTSEHSIAISRFSVHRP